MLDEPAVETSVEANGREASVDTQPRHATRSTRNGRADVDYSQKYHPMDEVTRPKRAARITGSRPPTSFTDTSDEEEPELSSGEGTDADEPSDVSDTHATRMPDPRAVRHSSRTEAKKLVNYSKQHHPQDWAIMGFRRSAKRKMRCDSSDKAQKKKRKEQAFTASPIVLSSDKTSDSDSEDEDEDDEPSANHPPTDAASSSRSQSESPDTYRVGSDGADAQSPKGNSAPLLTRGESSFNRADATIQGSYISLRRHTSQAVSDQSEANESANDDPGSNFDNKTTREIGDAMGALIDGVATPNATTSNSTSSDNATPDAPIVVQPSATMPPALVTPASMGPLNKVCTQPKTQLAINRPYMATQPNPFNVGEGIRKPDQAKSFNSGDDFQRPDQAKPLNQLSFKVSTAPVRSTTSPDPGEELRMNRDTSPEDHRHGGFSNASRQAMRDVSEDAARTARAKEVTSQLSSGILSQSHASQKNRDAGPSNVSRQVSRDTLPGQPGSSSVSRQVSRDTLPDQPGSSFFDDAMAGAQVHSQPDRHDDCDDNPQRLFSGDGYSQLPVSGRERSDPSASREQPSSGAQHNGDIADDADQPLPTETAGTDSPDAATHPFSNNLSRP